MRTIYAVDIGSTRPGRNGDRAFAWASVGKSPLEQGVRCSSDIDLLVKEVEEDLLAGYSVALGFEAPLFIPVPKNSDGLSYGRDGDSNRSWAAPAGSSVATLAVHQSAWLLRNLAKSCAGVARLELDYEQWSPRAGDPVLLLWEAFVSGKAHSEGHKRDAATAATFFLTHEGDLSAKATCGADNPISLIGSAALWAGWSQDLKLLHANTLVLKPTQSFEGKLCVV